MNALAKKPAVIPSWAKDSKVIDNYHILSHKEDGGYRITWTHNGKETFIVHHQLHQVMGVIKELLRDGITNINIATEHS